MSYKLGDTHISININRVNDDGEDCWVCTAYIGNSIAMQLETPYNWGDIKSNIEHEFCRMIALELSKSISLLLLCKEEENE
jgi:hypothetical protein